MISFSAFSDELVKLAAPPLPAAASAAAAKLAPKVKQYGQEGFNALMQGAKDAPKNPFQGMKLGGALSKLMEGIGGATRGGNLVGGTTKATAGFEDWAKNRASSAVASAPKAGAGGSGKWPLAASSRYAGKPAAA